MATRRDALAGLAAGSASAVLARAAARQPASAHMHDETADAGSTHKARTPRTFHGRDYETIAALCELIIPRTDTPGAVDAGVPWRIDQAVSGKPELQALYKQGISDLNDAANGRGNADFLSLPKEDQIAVLTDISREAGTRPREFFESVKALTIEWYYNTQEGLAQELGFKGDTYRTQFTGCTHPEHWPIEKKESDADKIG